MGNTIPSIKLTYFDIQGVAEKVRLALVLQGIKFEDERIAFPQWAELKPKTKYGQLPMMEINGKTTISQSNARLRYVARLDSKTLYPTEPVIQLRIEEVLGLCDDFTKAFAPCLYLNMRPANYGYPEDHQNTEEGKALVQKMRTEFHTTTLPKFLGWFTDFLGDNKFLVGNNVTIADCVFLPMIARFTAGDMDHIPKECLDGHPKILEYIARMKALPKIAAWYAPKEAPKEASKEEATKEEAPKDAAAADAEAKEEAPKEDTKEEAAALKEEAAEAEAAPKEEAKPEAEAAPAAAATATVNAAKRVLMVLTSNDKLGETGEQTGWYLPEVAHPHYVFEEAGFKLTYASINGGVAPLDVGSVDASTDEESQKFVKDEKLMALTKETIPIADAKAEDYDVVFYAGGFGVMWDFPDSEASAKLAGEIYDNGGIVSAVCHGPCALVNVKTSDGEFLVKGKKVTAFTNAEEDAVKRREIVPFTCEDKLTELGAEFVDGGVFQESVQISDRLMTGQNPPSAGPLAKAIVKALA